jgi:hypothetical protein
MTNSAITYEVGLERIDDLRRAADHRRRADVAGDESGMPRGSMSGRKRRGLLRDALATLSPRRPAHA